jgi:hypothetical protein
LKLYEISWELTGEGKERRGRGAAWKGEATGGMGRGTGEGAAKGRRCPCSLFSWLFCTGWLCCVRKKGRGRRREGGKREEKEKKKEKKRKEKI